MFIMMYSIINWSSLSNHVPGPCFGHAHMADVGTEPVFFSCLFVQIRLRILLTLEKKEFIKF